LRDPLSLEYEFINEIGEGCFGKIYKVRNRNSDIVSALKIERSKKSKVMLGNEIKILEILQGKLGVPCLYNNGFCKNGRWM
jgi:predicted Ser/Thr protein kinase